MPAAGFGDPAGPVAATPGLATTSLPPRRPGSNFAFINDYSKLLLMTPGDWPDPGRYGVHVATWVSMRAMPAVSTGHRASSLAAGIQQHGRATGRRSAAVGSLAPAAFTAACKKMR